MAAIGYSLDPRLKVLFADLGVESADMLRSAGLPADLFSRSPVTLSSSQFAQLWDAFVAAVADPSLPLRVATAMTTESFSPPIFAALCSANLNQAAQRLQTYKPLVGPMSLNVHVGKTATTISCQWTNEQPPPSFAVTELLFWVSLARIGTRRDIRPIAVTSTCSPTDQEPFISTLGVPVGSGPEHMIRFAAADAALPFLTASEALWEQFEPALRTRLAQVESSATMADRVRAALIELLPAGRASMGDVCQTLTVSTRTLQRRLQTEGTSFQEVLAATRASLAHHYLLNDTISTGEISFLLGCTEASSFYRAFHDWTGSTPDRVRVGAS